MKLVILIEYQVKQGGIMIQTVLSFILIAVVSVSGLVTGNEINNGSRIHNHSEGCHENGRYHSESDRSECENCENIEHEKINIEKGVLIEITSSDPEMIEFIQTYCYENIIEKSERPHGGYEIDINVEKIENGIEIIITSEDDETVKMIQENSNSEDCPGHFHFNKGCRSDY